MADLVTVDIGGTHARFALAAITDGRAIELGEPVTLHTSDHASFQTAWEDFAARSGGDLPQDVAIAIAGPIGGEVIRFTNNPWIRRPRGSSGSFANPNAPARKLREPLIPFSSGKVAHYNRRFSTARSGDADSSLVSECNGSGGGKTSATSTSMNSYL